MYLTLKLYSTQESCEEAQATFSETLTSIKACHEEERLSLHTEIEQLNKNLASNKLVYVYNSLYAVLCSIQCVYLCVYVHVQSVTLSIVILLS